MDSVALRVGVDLGGTKIEAAGLNADGTVMARQRVATPGGNYAETVKAVAELVASVEQDTGLRAPRIGIGTPGSLSPKTGLMRNANSTCLNGHRLDVDLTEALGRPVRLENDANCFALAEAQAGAAVGANVVFGVILGTGVGGGVVVDGKALLGRNRIGGEWGHNALPHPGIEELPGPACYCGRHGCIEAWCSGPAMAADHFQRAGIDVDTAQIAALAEAGDADCAETLKLHLNRLARALAGVVNLLDPDVIVLGGGLSNLEHLPRDLPEVMRPYVFSDCFDTPIVRNELGDSAGVIGAAWLWPTENET